MPGNNYFAITLPTLILKIAPDIFKFFEKNPLKNS
jgi:hypothetical protein